MRARDFVRPSIELASAEEAKGCPGSSTPLPRMSRNASTGALKRLMVEVSSEIRQTWPGITTSLHVKVAWDSVQAIDRRGAQVRRHVHRRHVSHFSIQPTNKEVSVLTCCTTGPVSEDNFFTWEALIKGPDDTPFEGGVFTAILTFPKDYPLNPPKV